MKLRMQITKDKDIRFISHLEYVRTIATLFFTHFTKKEDKQPTLH